MTIKPHSILIALLLSGCATTMTDVRKFEVDPDGMGIHWTGEYLTVREAKESGRVKYKGHWMMKEQAEDLMEMEKMK